MSIWLGVILAALVVWALKTLGYLIPQRLVRGALITRMAALTTVALLASLVVAQAIQNDSALVIDARVPAVAVAGVLLAIKAPFWVVLVSAGVVAAGLRFFGVLP
jgi:branched-subunit amino acid transport protein